MATKGPFTVGDVYYSELYKDWVIVLPNKNHFPLNTSSYDCPHHGKVGRHRCWDVQGDAGLKDGDASKLTLSPSILVENVDGTIHGHVTNGKWVDC